jgi:hypothetical protein
LAAIIGTELPELEVAVTGAAGDRQSARRALATALALAWLAHHAAAARAEWAMLAEKATRWLASCGASPADGGSWIDLAASIVEKA